MRRGTKRKATPWRTSNPARRAVAGGLSSALLLGGCGGKDEQANEERIQRERAEAAVIAKQDERIKQLQREQRESRRGNARPPPVAEPKPEHKSGSSSGGSSRTSDDWPGGAAYTTILASKGSQSEARRIQTAASGRGLDAGVLYSTNYRSLRPGFWVVFSGTSSSKQDADRRTARAKALGYGDAYPRFVSG